MDKQKKTISMEEVGKFLEGRDPQERIVNLLYNYQNNYITVVYRNENDQKCTNDEPFFPFVWATKYACLKLAQVGKDKLTKMMREYGIWVKKLNNTDVDGNVIDSFNDGYMFQFYSTRPMSYQKFLEFFRNAGNPVYSKDNTQQSATESRQYLAIPPQEQFLIQTGKRFFKGYDDYDQLLRMIFDLETEGLNPRKDRIKLNGVKLNRPVTINGVTYKDWGRIFDLKGKTKEEKDKSELEIIETMLKLIYTFKPDVITAHNGENFDWYFLIVRCEELGTSMEELSSKYFKGDYIRKEEKPSILKLGGEIEEFHRTIVPFTIITDSLHAVRRAQATDSNFKESNLKYSAKYLKLKKENRVYTPGAEIDKILVDTEHQYAFNDKDGDWYLYDPNSENGKDIEFKKGKDGDRPFIKYIRNYLADGYELVTGRYIIERYLLDDLWECDRVESKLNTANFFICKILPIPFSKCTTMGTAGQWKSIMLAWSYDNNLAIPIQENEALKVGGLSRLLSVGRSENILKYDYNSLYPSITLTWGIEDWPDLLGVTLPMLEYVLTSREKFKGLKKAAGKIIDEYDKKIINGVSLTDEETKQYQKAQADYALNDKIQNSFKILGNSYFGSVSASNASVYPWKSSKNGHQITCIGRQCLRLLISHFTNLKGPNGETEGYGYRPLVGDSFTGDTPLFIKYKDTGFIDIKPISELIDEEETEIDELGREYDYSKKNFYVLCRSGWAEPSYIYRHKTEKDIYEVIDGDTKIEVTEDHSLFNDRQEKLKPSEITPTTNLEYFSGDIFVENTKNTNVTEEFILKNAVNLASGVIDRVPLEILNANKTKRTIFYKNFIKNFTEEIKYSKTCVAGLLFLTK